MRVQSIYRSLDGEANGYENSGQPTTFVRLRGCNLRCKWCDTVYAQEMCFTDRNPGSGDFSVLEVLEQIHTQKVTLTGGEPLLYGSEVATLIGLLILKSCDTSVETNGSISLENFGLFCMPRNRDHGRGSVRFVVDYKLPSSGVERNMMMDRNVRILQPEDVVKFVIADEKDLERAVEVYKRMWYGLGCKAKIVFSPAISMTPQGPDLRWAATLGEKVCDLSNQSSYPIQFSLQIHKVLWPYANATNEK